MKLKKNRQDNNKKPEVVVITGASAGLGRAIVRRFAQDGAHIGLAARGRDGLEGAKADVEKLGGKAIIIEGDVADAETHEKAAKMVEDEFGEIDIWINNAMVSVFSPVKEMKPEEYKRVTEVTYLGFVYGTLAALKTNVAQRSRRNRASRFGSRVSRNSACSRRIVPQNTQFRALWILCEAS